MAVDRSNLFWPDAGNVEIWHCDTALLPSENDTLSAHDRARAARMATPALQARSRARRGFLRTVLGRYLSLRPRDVSLSLGKQGKPYLDHAPDLHFNLSHSQNMSVLALGRVPLGIDLEFPRSLHNLDRMISGTCSDREQTAIAMDSAPELAFFRRWVRKEAVLKCRGTGLVDDLPKVDTGPDEHTPSPWEDLWVHGVSLGSEVVAAIATPDASPAITIRRWPEDAPA